MAVLFERDGQEGAAVFRGDGDVFLRSNLSRLNIELCLETSFNCCLLGRGVK
ncbi:hypothetical protein CCP2SC5_240038 [Azospirillaceae bacterium]